MAKKKTAKEMKRLKKRAREVTAANLTLEKQVRKLKKKLAARERQIAVLEGRLDSRPQIGEVANSLSAAIGNRDSSNIASSQRADWKQHSYLRDRYETHLNAGATKVMARRLANEDLKKEYGPSCGYTEEELSAILS